MDYCYDPDAPLVSPPTSGPTEKVLSGCSAEVRSCPGGFVVRRDPNDDCRWAACPPAPATPRPTARPTRRPTPLPDASSYYCGYSVDQVNGNCAGARPCPSGDDRDCAGLEGCLRTSCGSPPSQTAATADDARDIAASAAAAAAGPCDDLCVDVLPGEWCPDGAENLNLPDCLAVGVGQLCEGDGECATDDTLNNCGTYDVYARVPCSEGRRSQGELMRLGATAAPAPPPTGRPTRRPTPPPTPTPATAGPTRAPLAAPTLAPTLGAMGVLMNMATEERAEANGAAPAPEGATVTIADAIATATANSEAERSPQTATPPPIQEYQSNAAATFTFDRQPGGGGGGGNAATYDDGAADQARSEEPLAVGSAKWYDSGGDDEPSAGSGADSFAWESYFRAPQIRSAATATMMKPLTAVAGNVVAMMLLLSC